MREEDWREDMKNEYWREDMRNLIINKFSSRSRHKVKEMKWEKNVSRWESLLSPYILTLFSSNFWFIRFLKGLTQYWKVKCLYEKSFLSSLTFFSLLFSSILSFLLSSFSCMNYLISYTISSLNSSLIFLFISPLNSLLHILKYFSNSNSMFKYS